MITGFFLATLNAILNSLSAIFIVLGFVAIKRRDIARHKRMMLSAFITSTLFLASYITRFAMFGDTRFSGTGVVRTLYFVLLISHVLLATLVAPGVVYTLYRGLRDERAKHRAIGRKVLPVWAYVSVTGVMVYLALYHYP
ncbi:MAG: DUF420 domain-containing protein [Myxococcales bacterium]|nr:DUF420 domain-containing protein [Myxococcales bacterium]